ncbi:MAG TPA: hypothetical protein VJJ21_05280 [Candidatus Nanoarchaeia archaeon]|nr:hypothetical protein [Candidatus Nanoarchaeia archaeon]
MPREDVGLLCLDRVRKLELLISLANKYPCFRDTNAVDAFCREEGLELKEGKKGELVLDTGLVVDLVYVPDGKGGYILVPRSDPIKYGRGILYHGCGSNREALESIRILYQIPRRGISEAAKG